MAQNDYVQSSHLYFKASHVEQDMIVLIWSGDEGSASCPDLCGNIFASIAGFFSPLGLPELDGGDVLSDGAFWSLAKKLVEEMLTSPVVICC